MTDPNRTNEERQRQRDRLLEQHTQYGIKKGLSLGQSILLLIVIPVMTNIRWMHDTKNSNHRKPENSTEPDNPAECFDNAE